MISPNESDRIEFGFKSSIFFGFYIRYEGAMVNNELSLAPN